MVFRARGGSQGGINPGQFSYASGIPESCPSRGQVKEKDPSAAVMVDASHYPGSTHATPGRIRHCSG